MQSKSPFETLKENPFEDLPAPPATALAKKHTLRWVVVSIVGIFVALAIIGTFVDTTETARPTRPAPITAVSPGLTVDEAQAQAAPLVFQAADELHLITETSAIAADFRHLNNAADFLDEASALFEGVDNTSASNLAGAADHLRYAANAEIAGEWSRFQQEASAAQDLLEAELARVQGTYS